MCVCKTRAHVCVCMRVYNKNSRKRRRRRWLRLYIYTATLYWLIRYERRDFNLYFMVRKEEVSDRFEKYDYDLTSRPPEWCTPYIETVRGNRNDIILLVLLYLASVTHYIQYIYIYARILITFDGRKIIIYTFFVFFFSANRCGFMSGNGSAVGRSSSI